MPVSQVSACLSAMEAGVLALLLPCLAVTAVDRAVVSGDLVSVWVRAAADGAACPGCGTWCTKVRGRYWRRLRDTAAGGRRVLIWLLVRLLRCGSPHCPKRSFAEQPAGLASPWARKTPLMAGQLGAVAAALAGRAGSRLARAVLAIEVSRDTLIRVLMAVPDPPAGPVRVLGVDDFALARGHAYATLLVDMETGRPADLLPDREAATLQAWLTGHPGVEVICRDRAGAYAQGAADGAPGAVQVADRWHLWHNLCEYAGKAAARHRDCLREPDAGDCRHQDQDRDREQEAGDLETVIRERHAAVRELRAGGADLAAAAAALGLGVQVTGRYWRAATAGDLLAAARSAPGLDPFKARLRQRWDQGATNISALHKEITAAGYAGSYSTTYGYAGLFRLAAPPAPPAPPDARQAAGWILTDPARLDPADAAALAAILARCPELSALAAHVTEFAKILTGLHGTRLAAWLDDADTGPARTELRSFTRGIRRDYQAVLNGLTLPWNSGRVEGLNTRTKLIKRQMYGRAGFPLLRKRILDTS